MTPTSGQIGRNENDDSDLSLVDREDDKNDPGEGDNIICASEGRK